MSVRSYTATTLGCNQAHCHIAGSKMSNLALPGYFMFSTWTRGYQRVCCAGMGANQYRGQMLLLQHLKHCKSGRHQRRGNVWTVNKQIVNSRKDQAVNEKNIRLCVTCQADWSLRSVPALACSVITILKRCTSGYGVNGRMGGVLMMQKYKSPFSSVHI